MILNLFVYTICLEVFLLFQYDVSPDEQKKLKTWQWPDQWLYDHFKQKLRVKILKFGEEKMKEKVSELRGLQRGLVAKCIEGEADREASEERPFVPWKKDIVGYKMRQVSNSFLNGKPLGAES